MTTDSTAVPGLSESKAKWTDSEKMALLIAVVNDTNPNPNWANLKLPQGRTLRASQTIYGQLKKDAAAHPMADGTAIPASKKRGRKPANGNEWGGPATPKKRVGGRKPAGGNEEGAPATPKERGGGRKPKNVDRTAASSPVVEDEEKPSKRIKTQAKGDDEGEGEDWVEAEAKGEEEDSA